MLVARACCFGFLNLKKTKGSACSECLSSKRIRDVLILGSVVLMAIGLSSACMKRKSKLSAVMGATVSGYAANEAGNSLPNVDVLLEGASTPMAKTDASGHFRAVISETYLGGLAKSSPAHRQTWSVFLRQTSGRPIGGMSEALPMTARGDLDVGVITMKGLSTLNGRVLKANGKVITAAANAIINIGPDRLVTDANGSFQLRNAIPGKNQVTAELGAYEKTLDVIDVDVAAEMNREEPVVLFNTTLPTAVLIPKVSLSPHELDGARTTRSFYVKGTPSAKYIRYYHKIEELEKMAEMPADMINSKNKSMKLSTSDSDYDYDPDTQSNPIPRLSPVPTSQQAVPKGPSMAQWREITPTIDYAFETAGSSTLWYQVLGNNGVASDLLQVTININSCSGLKSLILNGGAPLTLDRHTLVSFSSLPNNATRVRLTEDMSTLSVRPWLAVGETIDFLLSNAFTQNNNNNNNGSNSNNSVISVTGTGILNSKGIELGTHQVFAEVETSTGTCPIVSAAINLQPFPMIGPMFSINGGAPVSPSKIVMIDIPNVPPNAVDMRVLDITAPSILQGLAAGSQNGIQVGWRRAEPHTIFFFRETGSRMLSLEFRDRDGLTSVVYTDTIDIIPDQLTGFRLSFFQMEPGPPVAIPPPSRYLVMQLLPPQNATAFRYLEVIRDTSSGACPTQDESVINGLPWLNMVPFLPIYACGVGLRKFDVQYLTLDGQVISTTNTIMIVPVPETQGSFVINDGSPLTLFPTVKLHVQPAAATVSMSATNLSVQQTTANNSTVYLYGSNFGSAGTITTNDQWLQPVPEVDFRLDSRGVQTVQIRFRDGNQNIFTPSAIRSIFFDPFPHYPVGVTPLLINGGAATATSPLVSLHIIAPESAYGFSVTTDLKYQSSVFWEDIPIDVKTALPGVTWKVFDFVAPYLLTGDPGPKIIYVQFKNELGDRSEALSAVIDYQPVP